MALKKLFLTAPKTIQNSKDPTKVKFVGYSGDSVDLSDVGFDHPVVYDLSTIRIKNQKLPMMYNHRTDVGETTKINNSKVDIDGFGILNKENKATERIVNAGKRGGFQYQTSLGIDVRSAKIQFIRNGRVRVNNRDFDGPVFIVRNGLIDEVTVTEQGRDGNTSVRLLNSKISKVELMRIKNSKPKDKVTRTRSRVDNNDPPVRPKRPTNDPTPIRRRRVTNRREEYEEEQPVGITRKEYVTILRLQNKYPKSRQVIEEGLDKGYSLARIKNAVKMDHLERQLPEPAKVNRKGGIDLLEARLLNTLAKEPEKTLAKKYGEKARDEIMDLPHIGLKELLVTGAHRLGKSFTGYSDVDELIRFSTNHNRQRLLNMGFSTFDLPAMFRSTVQAVMEEAWRIEGFFAPSQCYVTSNNNFLKHERYRPSGGDMWDGLDAEGKIKHGKMGKSQRYITELDTKAQILVFNREMIENDDMGAIQEIIRLMIEGSLIVPDYKLVQHMLQANGGFFQANVNDFAGANYTLTEPHLLTAYTAAQKQIINKGRVNWVNRLGNIWQLVVGNAAMEHTAWQIINQVNITDPTAGRQGTKNFWNGKLEIVPFNQLSNETFSPKVQNDMWFLWPKGVQYAPFAITYLRGKKTPTVETKELPADMLGFGIRGYLDVEINDREPSAIYRFRPTGSVAADPDPNP